MDPMTREVLEDLENEITKEMSRAINEAERLHKAGGRDSAEYRRLQDKDAALSWARGRVSHAMFRLNNGGKTAVELAAT